MKETIIDLFHGSIAPYERLGVGNREIAHLGELIERNHQNLLCGLTDEQKGIFEKYVDCVSEMNVLLYEDSFAEGYRLDVRMTVEAFLKD